MLVQVADSATPTHLIEESMTMHLMFRRWPMAVFVLAGAMAAHPAQALGNLENPQPGASVSGISVVSGWHCHAGRIELEFDGTGLTQAAYGTGREDTLGVCGKTNTGFALLINWATLGAGSHTVRALADGVEFARAAFQVASLGAEFLVDKSATTTISDFPEIGKSVVLAWQQSAQSFVVQQILPAAPGLAGTWLGANIEARSNCSQVQNNGNRGTYGQYGIGLGAGAISISFQGVTGLQCTYSGTHVQNGPKQQASGTYVCTDGKRGSWQSENILVTANEMSLKLAAQLDTTETCTVTAILGGSRL